MTQPDVARISIIAALFVALTLLSLWQAIIARAALDDTEFGRPGYPFTLILWGGFQGMLLTITFFAGRLL